ncbi:MAG TPA: agmatinase family protein [Alphaproteobacteria bacterium]|nr:agmatinase family protein [Alphaproteobacteria bacterium]
MPDPKTGELRGNRNLQRLARISQKKQEESLKRELRLGLSAAPSVEDRTISLFSRGPKPAFAGINTFMKAPYCEDIRQIGKYEAAFIGAPFDMGTTYRPGARFGPQAVRRISALYDGYSIDAGVDLTEELDLCDAGDIFVIPSNLEKTFDQVSKAVSYVYERGVFPVICGGDHSLGFPNVRGVAPHIRGNVGIIHLDRHLDISEKDMDERMHTTPWYWTTHEPNNTTHAQHTRMHDVGLPNCHPKNLVQMGIGGWYGARPGALVARRRGTSVMTVTDIEELGVDKAAEMALGLAWEGCKAVYLSFDIDSVDAGFVPGTGSPEPGGLLPREALKLLRLIAREGLCAMEVVEISPPYDVSDMTAQLGCRAMLDVLGTLVVEGHIGHRKKVMKPERPTRVREPEAERRAALLKKVRERPAGAEERPPAGAHKQRLSAKALGKGRGAKRRKR